MIQFRLFLACIALGPAIAGLSAAPAAPSTIEVSHPGEFVFSFLPRPFQKDPKIDLAVITEVTPEGKKLTLPTAARPVYYEPHSSGYHDEGQGFSSSKKLAVETLEHHLEIALASSHYLVADQKHRPGMVIFFIWGAANGLDPSASADGVLDPTGAEDIAHQNLLARARLVGGIKFAHDYQKVLNDEDLRHATGMARGVGSPLEQFLDRDNGTTRQLVEQAKADCFYVVASAYDMVSLTKSQRKLLWRTSMTANSQGVSQAETLPTLITAGGPYFGREMTGPATLRGHLVPIGTVEIGTPIRVPEKPAAAH